MDVARPVSQQHGIAITPTAVRGALSALRHPESTTAGSSRTLHGLALVGERLRRDGIVDRPTNRDWALQQILCELVEERLAAARAPRSGSRPAIEASIGELEALVLDIQSRVADRETWGLLHYRFLAEAPMALGLLPERLGVSRRTITRRLRQGLEALAGVLQEREVAARADAIGSGGPSVLERIEIVDARDQPDERATPTSGTQPWTEPAGALAAALAGDLGPVSFTRQQLALISRQPIRDIESYRLSRVARWCGPEFRLHRRFVRLGLLLDQGIGAGDRWQPDPSRYDSVTDVLSHRPEAALILLGPPGSGKSTLLRNHELELSVAGLRGESEQVTLFVPLNAFGAPHSELEPRAWLGDLWQRRCAALPPLEDLLASGRMTLLLDGLNEMPSEGPQGYARRVERWRRFTQEVASVPGNRLVFSCRSLDYSSPLSSEAVPVPQAMLDALSDEDMRSFLAAYVPAAADRLWTKIHGSAIHDLLRRPFLLRLFVDRAMEGGGIEPVAEAKLYESFVRRALVREIERGNPLFLPGPLLSARERRALIRREPDGGASALPAIGPLVPGLEALAAQAQSEQAPGAAGLVRLSRPDAISILGAVKATQTPALAETILDAARGLGVLEEDNAGISICFSHQRFQEYFSARRMAATSKVDMLRRPWSASEVVPALEKALADLPEGARLPPLPTTGWEETAILAAQLTDHPADFVRALAHEDLVTAARAAATLELPADALADLRMALLDRSRDLRADPRARIAAGLALGDLGDPRFERKVGPLGPYLETPLIAFESGEYWIGSNEPILASGVKETVHMPRHSVRVPAFEIGTFLLTNAEFDCFVAAGGYDDPRWWRTEVDRRFWRGENTAEADRRVLRYWVERIRVQPDLLDDYESSGAWPEETCQKLRKAADMDADELLTYLEHCYPAKRMSAPRYRTEPGYENASLPVVGISSCEANAYCHWISEQTGHRYRLPTEVEWEVAAGAPPVDQPFLAQGSAHRRIGDANYLELRIGGPTPVGVFPASASPAGVEDLLGNVHEMTASIWGTQLDDCEYRYPYDPLDGREQPFQADDQCRVIRGACYYTRASDGRRVIRLSSPALGWSTGTGMRILREKD